LLAKATPFVCVASLVLLLFYGFAIKKARVRSAFFFASRRVAEAAPACVAKKCATQVAFYLFFYFILFIFLWLLPFPPVG
jgi:hypothetical protein